MLNKYMYLKTSYVDTNESVPLWWALVDKSREYNGTIIFEYGDI